jgi:hypothetical protein
MVGMSAEYEAPLVVTCTEHELLLARTPTEYEPLIARTLLTPGWNLRRI